MTIQTWRRQRAERKQTRLDLTGDSPEKVAECGLRGEPDAIKTYAQQQGIFGAPLAGG